MTNQSETAARIRALNDAFRQTGSGRGSVLLTAGVQALGEAAIEQILCAVRCFDRFTVDNDPHDEHDFGVVNLHGERVFWKIDYYDLSCRYASPDPADPKKTYRALTIMRADEY